MCNTIGYVIEDCAINIPVISAKHIGEAHKESQRPHIAYKKSLVAVNGVTADICKYRYKKD